MKGKTRHAGEVQPLSVILGRLSGHRSPLIMVPTAAPVLTVGGQGAKSFMMLGENGTNTGKRFLWGKIIVNRDK